MVDRMQNINWLEEVSQRKEELFDKLFRQLAIDSVRNDQEATEEAPVGPGPLKALEDFLKMAEEDGFKTEQFGPWAGRIELGQGDELMGILGHVDVVPAGSGWQTDPFKPEIINDRIYARGSSDDKGPTVAAYFAIKLLRELGVEFNKRIHLIIGTDEESGWQCMDYYFQHAEMPDFGFSPDATFPIINGEKGNVSLLIKTADTSAKEGDSHLVSFKSGLRPNMVPEDARASIKVEDAKSVVDAFNQYLKENELDGTASAQDGLLSLHLIGKSAHGSTPEKGLNAGTYLATFLRDYHFDQSDAEDFIHLLSKELFQGFDGSKLGVNHTHDVMGEVSMNVGIINYTEDLAGDIDVNLRYPEGTNPEDIKEKASVQLSHYELEINLSDAKEPHYVPASDPLVQTLLEVYEKQTGLEGHEMTIGGGTYGRLMPRGVAYGALFPDSIDTMHQANEFIAVDDLLKATAIYAEAIYELTR